MTSHFQVSDPAQLEPGTRKKIWVNFKPDIDLGHMIAMFTFLGAMAVQWQTLNQRVTIVEQKQVTQAEQAAETKSDIKEIKATVTKIGTDLAVQNALAARKP